MFTAIIIAILKAKGGLSGLPSSDSSAPKSATYSNGGGANGTANSPVATHLSAANLTSMLPLMRQGMTPLSSYISNPSSLPVDQHFATALAAAINGQVRFRQIFFCEMLSKFEFLNLKMSFIF